MKVTVSLLTITLTLAALSWAQECSEYNVAAGPFYKGLINGTQHKTGVHGDAHTLNGSCMYSGYQEPCLSKASADAQSPNYTDSGSLTVIGFHVAHTAQKGGVASGGGGLPAIADAESAVAFEHCLLPGCSFAVTLTGSGNGNGFTLTVPPDAIWSDSFHYTMSCPGEDTTDETPLCCDPDSNCGESLPVTGPQPQCNPSPVGFDLKGIGIKTIFSDPQNACVLFDINANGKPLCISWPKIASGWGWLVLPDKNKVTDGADLFGTATPQPNHPNKNPNGFLALAEYDLPKNGGNLDAVIDQHDKVWPQLKVWVDNHCQLHPNQLCAALPEELHPLAQFGITSISLLYNLVSIRDAWKNNFKLSSAVNVKGGNLQHSADPRIAYDVWLVPRK